MTNKRLFILPLFLILILGCNKGNQLVSEEISEVRKNRLAASVAVVTPQTISEADAKENVNDDDIKEQSGEISLTVDKYTVLGLQKAYLSWIDATSTRVDIIRDGSVVAKANNSGYFTDHIDNRGSGSYTYKVCETGTTACSSKVIIQF